MSNIPYKFFPIPHEMLTDEFIDDPKMMRLIRYIFKRINTKPHIEKIRSNGWHTIHLQPFEFIFGREKCMKETGLTAREIRTRIKTLTTSSLVRVATISSTSSFTVYTLLTASFCKNCDQQNDQQNDQQFDHKQEAKNKEHIACLKEASKKREIAASLPLSQKEKEDSESIFAYLAEYSISMPSINRWIKKYSPEKVVKTINLMKRKGKQVKNHGAWIETALKENFAQEEEFRLLNREFAIKFKNENNVKVLRINKNYCVDNSIDYQFNLPPQTFQDMLKRKYENN